jgi:membrane-bound metal-dependent hydrolase YbcI (DUF457 family)
MGGPVVAVAAGSLLGMLGGIAPDIDHPRSRVTRLTGPIHYMLVASISNPIAKLALGPRRVAMCAGHRGVTHSALALVLFGLLLQQIVGLVMPATEANLGAITAAAGYASHLCLDMCTVAGVPLALPWSLRRYRLLPRWASLGRR